MNLTFDPATHEYRWNGQRVPSVTQAMGLLYHEVYRFAQASGVARGSDVHERIHDYETGRLRQIEVDYLGYLEAWRGFKAQFNLGLPTLSEQILYSKRWGFAGKPDNVFGDLLVDVKTSASPSPLTAIQTAAYAQLVAESGAPRIKRRMEVLLQPSGKWSIQVFKDQAGDFRLFLCCLSLHQFHAKNFHQKTQEGGLEP